MITNIYVAASLGETFFLISGMEDAHSKDKSINL
jgi:hypothetical protein